MRVSNLTTRGSNGGDWGQRRLKLGRFLFILLDFLGYSRASNRYTTLALSSTLLVMQLRSDQQRYFRTTSLTLATFLYAKGHAITSVNTTDSLNKKEFVFIAGSQLEELVDAYKYGDRNSENLLIPVHVYEHARNELLDRINE